MDLFFYLVMAAVSCLALAWQVWPRLIARSISKRQREIDTLTANKPVERDQLILKLLDSLDAGIQIRMRAARLNSLTQAYSTDPKWRPFKIEGQGLGFGILASSWHARLKNISSEWPTNKRPLSELICRGAGIWSAKRHGRDYQSVLIALKPVDAWDRNHCIDGYGFKFGLFEFLQDRRNLAHLHAIPGANRRSAFHGVGRAFYLLFLNDRRSLFEAVGEFAPEHDPDLIEGAAYMAGLIHCDELPRAINFARAVPYEWRAHAHLGLTLGIRLRKLLDPDYFRVCTAQLSLVNADVIERATRMADETESRFRLNHASGGFYVWREKLMTNMQQLGTWDPTYTEAVPSKDQKARGG